MKKLLKLLWLPIVISTPAVTVIACSSIQGISDEDVLQSAVGRMKQHIFGLEELKLKKLPNNGDKYQNLAKNAQDIIADHYANLVKEGLNWDYSTVGVAILGQDKVFVNHYGDNVEVKVELKIKLTYKNAAKEADVIVKISNDRVTDADKVKAIIDYLKFKLKENNIVSVKTLFTNNLKKANPAFQSEKLNIEKILKLKILSSDVIDVKGVKLNFVGPFNEFEPVYKLSENNSTTDKAITGKLTNLKLSIGLNDEFQEFALTQELEVKQSIDDANNQLANILSTNPIVLKFYDQMPENNDLSIKEMPNYQQHLETLQKKLFSIIEKIYPHDEKWDSSKITIENLTTQFIREANGGYFLVDLKIAGEFKGQKLNTSVKNIKLKFLPTTVS